MQCSGVVGRMRSGEHCPGQAAAGGRCPREAAPIPASHQLPPWLKRSQLSPKARNEARFSLEAASLFNESLTQGLITSFFRRNSFRINTFAFSVQMGISLAPQLLPYNILLNQIFTETFAENNSLAASEISSPANTSLWKSCDKQLGHPQRGSHPRLSYKAHEPFQNHIFTN